jgi:predicted  nucleic acid-binding Zn-ribbon protein
MKEEKYLKERIALIERELATLTERLEGLEGSLKEVEDIRLEIEGIKLFLGRVHPDFKNQFPEIMQKIKG